MASGGGSTAVSSRSLQCAVPAFMRACPQHLPAATLRRLGTCCDSGHRLPGPCLARETIYFNPQQTRIAIVTMGSLCPGQNDVVRAIVSKVRWRALFFFIRHAVPLFFFHSACSATLFFYSPCSATLLPCGLPADLPMLAYLGPGWLWLCSILAFRRRLTRRLRQPRQRCKLRQSTAVSCQDALVVAPGSACRV